MKQNGSMYIYQNIHGIIKIITLKTIIVSET